MKQTETASAPVITEGDFPAVVEGHGESGEPNRALVTWRALLVGLLVSGGVAWLNCSVESLYNVHFVGGIQMPFASIFVLLCLILAVNAPWRVLHRFIPAVRRLTPLFTPAELLTIYAMSLFGALISTPGCDNHFLVTGPGLFYFSTGENGWANMFYQHVPSWFAPGWNGRTYQTEVINNYFNGGLTFAQIPWHAWSVMLIAWSVFMLLIYAMLFFVALLFRRQWIVNEALTFPLVELPLQMVEGNTAGQGQAFGAFWSNRTMWCGFAVAAFFHFVKGMNAHYPDWPVFPINIFDGYRVEFTEQPWSAIPPFNINIYWGAIGLAYLLTREVSFSFWFFFIVMLLQYAGATMLGFPAASMGKVGIMGRPAFLIYQGVGAWVMMAAILIWTAREHLGRLFRLAFGANKLEGEPFSPRFMVFGFLLSLAGLLAWTSFAGINFIFAAVFLGIFLITSLVLTRLVIEGGFLFPQAPFLVKEWMTTGMFGTATVGAANLTKLAFLEPMILYDMRTNTLPAFLHTLKIADALRIDKSGQRKLLAGVAVAIICSFAITIVTSMSALYSQGGLLVYGGNWGKGAFTTTEGLLRTQQGVDPANIIWMSAGAAVIWLLVLGRSRFLWFPLHPLGYLAAPAFPITQLWFSFMAGWFIKTVIMKYGGSSSYSKFQPFMIGLILGNLTAMVFWMFVGFKSGNQMPYWPA